MNIIHAAQAGQGGPVSIACINKATVDLGVPFAKLTATLQKCFDQHFLPIWGYPVTLYNTKTAKPTDWQFIYFDDADTAGALGYHDLTTKGQPLTKVFVKTTLADKQLVSVTACHELFEMVIDPIANLWAEAADGTEYAYEMCDPSRRIPSWSTGSRCRISCIRPGSSPSSIRPARNSITSACSRSPSP